MRIILTVAVLALGGCDMGHLGNPLMWPGMAVGSAVENTTYNARRKKVSDHVNAHQFEILTDIGVGGGPALDKAFDLARIQTTNRAQVLRTLQKEIAMYRPNTAEAREQLVIALMVNGR
ncbi:hypothetical protein [Profundibacter sp.]|uniref:hypothetical protein n=1 Tax=Profundibacter sp. TaxID=3101071 RepID=UPI003D14159E